MREGWQTKTLGDVCHVYQPETISQKQMAGGEYAVYGANGPIGWHNQFNHEEAQLILGCRGSCGSVHITAPRSWINGNAMVVQPKTDLIAPAYLAYALRGGVDLKDSITGTAQPQITRASLMPVAISYPEALSEQQRIVALLDEAFAGLATAKANAERNLQNARAIFESHLQSVFSERGEGWVEKQLRDFCSFENGDRGSNYPSKKARSATGIPFINAGHLTDDGIDLARMDYIPRERFDLLSNGKIRAGDILFCLRGSLGKFASVGDLDEGAIASSLVIVRPDETVLNDYLVAYFRSSLCASMINEFKNGTAQPNLSARSLGDFIAPLPPLPDQKLLVKELADLRHEAQHLTHLYERKLAALEELKKSLLHQAFNGEL
jgi:type I restriction enzyme S subunit